VLAALHPPGESVVVAESAEPGAVPRGGAGRTKSRASGSRTAIPPRAEDEAAPLPHGDDQDDIGATADTREVGEAAGVHAPWTG